MGRRYSDIAKVASAIACRYVHAPAKGHGKMREVTAHAPPLVERLPSGSGRASVRIIERGAWTKSQIACTRPQPIGEWPNSCHAISDNLAISASQQKNQDVSRQILHWVLVRSKAYGIGTGAVIQHGRAGDLHLPRRGDEPAAPVPKAIAIEGDRHCGQS